eukprot:CAMPEP_0194276090 /NCGR_PEP_ID=MMETSP0169-20130528/8761_1 /TAXON_ID=218684 /ORGANISM="Corethron pennatum, Strain L29A3" /LENGTH=720 /DNA_ID=CAMNT_0039019721 /DNA_START=710 /DNA_END=2872 /DNA_ORIENTATION=+
MSYYNYGRYLEEAGNVSEFEPMENRQDKTAFHCSSFNDLEGSRQAHVHETEENQVMQQWPELFDYDDIYNMQTKIEVRIEDCQEQELITKEAQRKPPLSQLHLGKPHFHTTKSKNVPWDHPSSFLTSEELIQIVFPDSSSTQPSTPLASSDDELFWMDLMLEISENFGDFGNKAAPERHAERQTLQDFLQEGESFENNFVKNVNKNKSVKKQSLQKQNIYPQEPHLHHHLTTPPARQYPLRHTQDNELLWMDLMSEISENLGDFGKKAAPELHTESQILQDLLQEDESLEINLVESVNKNKSVKKQFLQKPNIFPEESHLQHHLTNPPERQYPLRHTQDDELLRMDLVSEISENLSDFCNEAALDLHTESQNLHDLLQECESLEVNLVESVNKNESAKKQSMWQPNVFPEESYLQYHPTLPKARQRPLSRTQNERSNEKNHKIDSDVSYFESERSLISDLVDSSTDVHSYRDMEWSKFSAQVTLLSDKESRENLSAKNRLKLKLGKRKSPQTQFAQGTYLCREVSKKKRTKPKKTQERNISQRNKKKCSNSGCIKFAQTGGKCVAHGGGKKCLEAGCNKCAQAAGKCYAHGVPKICTDAGCSKYAMLGGKCFLHGGGKRCSEPGCGKCAKVGGKCVRHGGGKRCLEIRCTKSAQAGGRCAKHGGGKRCSEAGCKKSAKEGGKCIAHGGGKRCSEPGCTKSNQKGGKCIAHGISVPHQMYV